MKTVFTKKNLILLFSISCVIVVSMLLLLTGCSNDVEVKLYFAQYEDNQAFLQPEIRSITADDKLYKSIVEELVRGPESEQLYPTLPSNTVVYSVITDDGLAIADFSKELITEFEEIPHSSTTEILAIYSIVNTLTEFDEIERVRITIEGRQSGEIDGLFIEDFWGHVGIYEDFTRNEDVMEKGSIE